MVAHLAGGSSSQVIKLLVNSGIEVEEVKKAIRSLEEIYLQIVQDAEGGANTDE